MSSISLAPARPVLVDRVLPRSLVTDLSLVVGGVALTAAAAQLYIPMWPVPITGQTFAVLFVGASLGMARAALSLSLYLALAVAGLPILAPNAGGGHTTGLAVLALPTLGFLVGFIVAAAVVGWLAQREWDRKVVGTFVAFVTGTVVIYAFGLPWLSVILGSFGLPNDLGATLQAGLVPFIIGDVIKALIAAAILPASWMLIRRLDARRADRD